MVFDRTNLLRKLNHNIVTAHSHDRLQYIYKAKTHFICEDEYQFWICWRDTASWSWISVCFCVGHTIGLLCPGEVLCTPLTFCHDTTTNFNVFWGILSFVKDDINRCIIVKWRGKV